MQGLAGARSGEHEAGDAEPGRISAEDSGSLGAHGSNPWDWEPLGALRVPLARQAVAWCESQGAASLHEVMEAELRAVR